MKPNLNTHRKCGSHSESDEILTHLQGVLQTEARPEGTPGPVAKRNGHARDDLVPDGDRGACECRATRVGVLVLRAWALDLHPSAKGVCGCILIEGSQEAEEKVVGILLAASRRIEAHSGLHSVSEFGSQRWAPTASRYVTVCRHELRKPMCCTPGPWTV